MERVCPYFHRAIELLGKRWTGAIVRVLLDGPRRFHELLERIPGLSDRLLAERLRELESEGIVQRTVYAEMPVRVEYRLTEKGQDLAGVIQELHRWADRWLARGEAAATR